MLRTKRGLATPLALAASAATNASTAASATTRRIRGRLAERVAPALQLGALHGVRAQLDGPRVRARGAVAVARAVQQLGVGGLQRLVALERRVVEQRRQDLQAGLRTRR